MKLKKLTTDDYLSVVENYRMFDIKSNCVDFGIEEMRERIRRYYHDFFVISTEEDKVFGYAYTYDFRMFDSNCKLKIITTEAIVENENMMLAYELIIKRLFEDYPLNYIYFNRLLDGNNLIEPSKIGFTRAALLQEYYYMMGNILM